VRLPGLLGEVVCRAIRDIHDSDHHPRCASQSSWHAGLSQRSGRGVNDGGRQRGCAIRNIAVVSRGRLPSLWNRTPPPLESTDLPLERQSSAKNGIVYCVLKITLSVQRRSPEQKLITTYKRRG